jgi:hypothetical protein
VAEVSKLQAKAPMFQPMLSPSTVAMLMPDVPERTPLRTPLRTKLCSKAESFAPPIAQVLEGPLPFVPMAAVEESWQKWHLQHSAYHNQAEYYPEQDFDLSYDSINDFSQEQCINDFLNDCSDMYGNVSEPCSDYSEWGRQYATL